MIARGGQNEENKETTGRTKGDFHRGAVRAHVNPMHRSLIRFEKSKTGHLPRYLVKRNRKNIGLVFGLEVEEKLDFAKAFHLWKPICGSSYFR